MSKRIDLQNYCLREMGIMRYQDRCGENDFSFLVIIAAKEQVAPNKLSSEKEALLTRMLQALNWSNLKTQIVYLKTSDELAATIAQYQARKILFFEFLINDKISIPAVTVPSLERLLHFPALKKQAWAAMQPLIEK